MKSRSKRKDLTSGDLKKHILGMTLPMILGMLGMVAFNFADSLFVGRLGETELAAISFTFPVIMFVMSISQGLSMGAGSVVSRYIGEKNEEWIKKTSTYSLLLAVIIVAFFAILGFFTIEPLFKLLGAGSAEMPFIKSYMRVWYFGVPFVVIPMMGNGIIRALGDTKIPSLVMTIAAGINIILDPLFIFGWGFEGMGITGAAIATVISRFCTFLSALYLLIKREKVLVFYDLHVKEFFKSAKSVLYIGVPTAVSRMIMPIGIGVLTAIIATISTADVAGFGAGFKIENIGMSVVHALTTVMIAVIGQNFGAKKYDRIQSSYRIASVYSLIYSLIAIPIFYFSAPLLTNLFKVSDGVKQIMVTYVRLAILGIGFLGVLNVSTSTLNAIRKPFKSAMLTVIYMFGIYVPSAYMLSRSFGTIGVFYATIIAYVLAGCISYLVTSHEIKKLIMTKSQNQ